MKCKKKYYCKQSLIVYNSIIDNGCYGLHD